MANAQRKVVASNIVLELTDDEASSLLAVLSNIGGRSERRYHISDISGALYDAGAKDADVEFVTVGKRSLYFVGD